MSEFQLSHRQKQEERVEQRLEIVKDKANHFSLVSLDPSSLTCSAAVAAATARLVLVDSSSLGVFSDMQLTMSSPMPLLSASPSMGGSCCQMMGSLAGETSSSAAASSLAPPLAVGVDNTDNTKKKRKTNKHTSSSHHVVGSDFGTELFARQSCFNSPSLPTLKEEEEKTLTKEEKVSETTAPSSSAEQWWGG